MVTCTTVKIYPNCAAFTMSDTIHFNDKRSKVSHISPSVLFFLQDNGKQICHFVRPKVDQVNQLQYVHLQDFIKQCTSLPILCSQKNTRRKNQSVFKYMYM